MAPNAVVLTIEKPSSFSLVEMNNGSESSVFLEKQKAVSTKQFTWFLFLRAHRAFTFLSWIAMAFRSVFVSVKKRIAVSNSKDVVDDEEEEEDPKNRGRLYRFLRIFLLVSIVALGIEIIAHFKEWRLNLYQPLEVQGLVQWTYMAWLSFRVDYAAPLLITLSNFCIALFLIQSLDRLVLCLGCLWIKVKKVKPVIDEEAFDIEDGPSFPMVLVQIPMCNEREVYAQSIAAACQLDWPRDRILIQVLDDSSDKTVQILIRNEVASWKHKGINIIYRHRFIRTGYKAGNLKSALACDYVKDYEFVAILDADFTPNPDFLNHVHTRG